MTQSTSLQKKGLGLVTKFLPYILTRKTKDSKPQNTSGLENTQTSFTLLQKIKDIPLEVFIDCIVDSNYSGLIVSGNPSKQALSDQFENIYEQYIEAVGGKELLRHIRQVKDIAIHQNRVISAENIIQTFKLYPTFGLYEQLFTYGYPLPKKPYNYANINDVLRIFVAHYKLDSVRLDRLIYEFEQAKLSKEKGTSGGYTRAYFIGSLVDMSEAFKFKLSAKELTTEEYCLYILRYKEYCEAKEKQISNVH